MEPSPIIFCHYGYSEYLTFVLAQVKSTNPKTRIILLGDDNNKVIAKECGIEHCNFSKLSETKEIKKINQVYQHVAGESHGKPFWTNFVFKRWFYVHSFLLENGINEFWHFDSDNMILDDLNKHKYKFDSYDCTEQCESYCINGFISGLVVVQGYVDKIISLFQDQNYLAAQREDLSKKPTFAFTEMRAYTAYRDQESIKSIRLNTIINGETFDDCICFDDGYFQYDYSINYRYLKKIYFNNNEIYFKLIKSKDYIKVVSLNLSWVSTEVFKAVSDIYMGKWFNSLNYKLNSDGFYELSLVHISQKNNKIISFLKLILPINIRFKMRKFHKRMIR